LFGDTGEENVLFNVGHLESFGKLIIKLSAA
jgi:hypothetical protein